MIKTVVSSWATTMLDISTMTNLGYQQRQLKLRFVMLVVDFQIHPSPPPLTFNWSDLGIFEQMF